MPRSSASTSITAGSTRLALPRRAVLWGVALAAVLALLPVPMAGSEVTATPDSFITFDSSITPRILPRTHAAPVAIRIEGHVKRRRGRAPVPLARIQLAIHRAAKIDRSGLPVCRIGEIDPASSAQALETCGGARVGHGLIKAESSFPGQPHYKFNGRSVLFNGVLPDGRPAILIHVFNARPPTSFVFPFAISRRPGRYGTVLDADVRLSRWSRITDFRLVLDRVFSSDGRPRSFLNASCPAPAGLDIGISPFVRATLGFGDGRQSRISVVSSCRVAP
jgi:hypothetical protein